LGETHRHYTRHVNFREGWRGHLWQERFHSFVMDESYLLATVRYVERNPVVAGLCRNPREWKWSSAEAHLNGVDDGLVNVKPLLERVDDWDAYLSGAHEDRDATQLIKRHSRTGRPLGNERFVDMLEAITGKSLAPKPPGRKSVRAE
jgi:putative transposase